MASASPKFKNVGMKSIQSPKEIKEKLRQNYKSKVKNCRGMLMDKLRRSVADNDLKSTLTDIYKSIAISEIVISDEEFEFLDELRNELVQEELEWWIKEHEKCQLYVEWSSTEDSNDVICPVCRKNNLKLDSGTVSCSHCNISIQTKKSLSEIKGYILTSVDMHNASCNSDAEFGLMTEVNESHVYLICDNCMEMKMVI